MKTAIIETVPMGAMYELGEDDVKTVSGGSIMIWAAAAAAVCGAINGLETVGEKMGKALYYASH